MRTLPTRQEVISVGFDDFLELTGTPPFSTGLRVPPFVGPTYRFLACTADLNFGDEVVGLRQFAEIAAYILEGGEVPPPAPVYPEKRPIVTSGWHFVDTAPMTWTVTFEPLANFVRRRGPFDQTSFILRETTGPALVYETAAFPAFPLLPGYLGLSAYTPPAMRGIKQYSLRDIRFPIQQNEVFAIRRPITTPTRVRVYVDVQQTNPATRNAPDFSTSLSAQQLFFVAGGMVPEEQFLQDFPTAVVHAVGAALIYDRNRDRREHDEHPERHAP
ncbi:MAG: hypothetical protein ACRDNM_04170 [Gaiellaceae bacterium]